MYSATSVLLWAVVARACPWSGYPRYSKSQPRVRLPRQALVGPEELQEPALILGFGLVDGVSDGAGPFFIAIALKI